MAEKDYRKIAAQRMYRPADTDRMPKILVYGRFKKGKSRFGISAGVDNTIVFDPEYGVDQMKTINPHVWPITKWEDIDDAVEWLRNIRECPKCKPTHTFTWASLDGATRMSNMALRYVMRVQEERSLERRPGMVDRRDYGKSGELMKELMVRLHNLHDVGVVYTAQERMEAPFDAEEDDDTGDGDEARFVPDLPKGVRGHLNSLVDVIGRLYTVKDDEDKTQRRLWLSDSLKYDTGYRSDYELPDYLRNPTVPRLVRLMHEGSLKKKAG